MRMSFMVPIFAAGLLATAAAAISTRVYLSDGQTPLAPVDPNTPNVYRDIMVGTELQIVISADAGSFRLGALTLPAEHTALGVLNARDYRGLRGYVGSRLPAAGKNAWMDVYLDSDGVGLQFNSGYDAVPGDWFILDYQALAPGVCDLRLETLAMPENTRRLEESIHLTQVPSRDFNGDALVNLADFALLTTRWRTASVPNAGSPFDLDTDGLIGPNDLLLFSRFWLDRTDDKEPAPAPDAP